MAVKKKTADEKKNAACKLASMHAAGFREGVATTELLVAAWLRSRGRPRLARMVESGAWEHDKKGTNHHG